MTIKKATTARLVELAETATDFDTLDAVEFELARRGVTA